MSSGRGLGNFETQANIQGTVTALQFCRVTVHTVLVLPPFLLRLFCFSALWLAALYYANHLFMLGMS